MQHSVKKALSLSKIVINVNYNFRSCTHCFILIRWILSRKNVIRDVNQNLRGVKQSEVKILSVISAEQFHKKTISLSFNSPQSMLFRAFVDRPKSLPTASESLQICSITKSLQRFRLLVSNGKTKGHEISVVNMLRPVQRLQIYQLRVH